MFVNPKWLVTFFRISSLLAKLLLLEGLAKGKNHPIINSCGDVFSRAAIEFFGDHLPPRWLRRGRDLLCCRCKELGEEKQAGKTKETKFKRKTNTCYTLLISLILIWFPVFLYPKSSDGVFVNISYISGWRKKNTFKAAPTSKGPGTSTMNESMYLGIIQWSSC